MKKYILIILIIIIIAVALGLVYYFLKPRPENGTSNGGDEKKPDYLVYADEKWNFEINYLTGWKEEKLQGEGLLVFEISVLNEESGISEASLLVLAFNPSSSQVFEDEMKESIERLKAENALTSSSKETISGANAYKLVYAYDDNFSGFKVKQQHYFINGGEVWYQILYTAREEIFDKHLLEAEQMAETFRIIK
jgi:hypothetical protein